MKRKAIVLSLTVLVLAGGVLYWFSRPDPPIETKFIQNIKSPAQGVSGPGGEQEEGENVEFFVNIKKPGDYALLENPKHTYRGATSFAYQTFNNCGPATLSMMLSWYGKEVGQKELGDKMRPYQNPKGNNDDKTIFTYEFVDWTKKYGLESTGRVNGDIELLKTFTANGIPVVVKTWLKVGEDIGHFRIVRGFDENRKVIIQDDSYDGPNKKISYYDFLSMWQPFNYAYMIVYTPDQKDLVFAIIGEEWKENIAWKNSLTRAQKESELDPENVYPLFNMSSAYYHLGDYQNSVSSYELVESRLPKRMLWYQIEPIQSYFKLGDYSQAFSITAHIFENGNRAFSELYQIRGEIYALQGNIVKAKEQFELAIQYNENFEPARDSLQSL